LIATDEHRLRIKPGAVFKLETAFFLESENGADKVLIPAHATGNTVHGDLEGSTWHQAKGKRKDP
jgi:hypothetical protein